MIKNDYDNFLSIFYLMNKFKILKLYDLLIFLFILFTFIIFSSLISSPTVLAADTCGVDQQQANPLPQGNNLNGVNYGNEQFVAVGGYDTILTSPDGLKWTQRSSSIHSNLNAVTWNVNIFVAVGDNAWNATLNKNEVVY